MLTATRPCLVSLSAALMSVAGVFAATANANDSSATVTLERDDNAGVLKASIDGREAFVYRYGTEGDLPHFWPLRSPSGKNMLTQQAEPYPHHRAFWFADTVQLAGRRKASFYAALYSGESNRPPFQDRVCHEAFLSIESGTFGKYRETLVWLMDRDVPVLNERRDVRIVPLGSGEYLLDITFTLTAAHGDVTFRSDPVHYAWPYLRINDTYNGAHGGTITNDLGQTGQKATNMQPARWVDYSNTVEGVSEGVAVFQWSKAGDAPVRWLTREYGTFGPR
ncbi:MAG: DUF6807 family protein, partial [Patescibacteria group bacterium]|nr:DUF6807 family protein [Patescibacteria group bacterium]